MWNGYLVGILGGAEAEINDKKLNLTPGIQKVFTDTSNISMKKLNDEDRKFFNKFLKSLYFENYKKIRGESKSGRYKQSETNFTKHNLKGQGIEKIIIPSNIIDIYLRLEILLGLNLSGQTDTLTETSNLNDELYKRGEIPNEHHYRNALDKIST